MGSVTSTFFFDGDCGLCQWSAEKLDALTDDELVVKPAWAGEHSRTPADVAQHISRYAVYVRLADDHVDTNANTSVVTARDAERVIMLGHRAIGQCLIDYGASPPVKAAGYVLTCPPLSPLCAAIYRLVANNRHRLGPLVGVEACRIS
ncbi:DUF393 domain-containing protein [Corynebacterium sp. 4HC-13]|uniref:DCC1-like thiol-disulfide oxidoreductase family protein n=1 Tax=Corynebacterium anserum TaxID=2684406 RepID=UPI00163B0BEE|nr:DCC1-like thiol-disulfide oxidoreductase family protein [Corynebacterium anserum]MBC2681867.1 DUF393 domain-containing protein [Corynebacterium anserum]